jgi:hypothetical protein
MRYLIALFQREKASSSSIIKPAELQPESQIAAITAEQRQALQELEDFQPIEIEGNSTQIPLSPPGGGIPKKSKRGLSASYSERNHSFGTGIEVL